MTWFCNGIFLAWITKDLISLLSFSQLLNTTSRKRLLWMVQEAWNHFGGYSAKASDSHASDVTHQVKSASQLNLVWNYVTGIVLPPSYKPLALRSHITSAPFKHWVAYWWYHNGQFPLWNTPVLHDGSCSQNNMSTIRLCAIRFCFIDEMIHISSTSHRK